MPFIDRVAFRIPTLNNKKIKNLKFPLAKWARLWHYIYDVIGNLVSERIS